MAKRRCTIEIQKYSRCCSDDIDNVAPRDIETSNKSIEFNDLMILFILCIEVCQRICEEQSKVGWAVSLNALRRNSPECAVAFDYIESLKIGVATVLYRFDPGRKLS